MIGSFQDCNFQTCYDGDFAGQVECFHDMLVLGLRKDHVVGLSSRDLDKLLVLIFQKTSLRGEKSLEVHCYFPAHSVFLRSDDLLRRTRSSGHDARKTVSFGGET